MDEKLYWQARKDVEKLLDKYHSSHYSAEYVWINAKINDPANFHFTKVIKYLDFTAQIENPAEVALKILNEVREILWNPVFESIEIEYWDSEKHDYITLKDIK